MTPSAGRPLNSKWDGRPSEYDDLRACWLNRHRLDFLVHELTATGLASASVLELGSGTGGLLHELAAAFPGWTFHGLEPDESYVAFASERALPNEHFVHGFAEAAPAALPTDLAFDLILSNDVLHHVRSLDEVFAAAASVSVTGAQWWAIEPNWLNPYTHVRQRYGTGEQNFYPRPALAAAAPAGWTLTDRDNLFLVPPFVREAPVWLQRLERRLEHNPILAGGLVLRLVRG